LEPLSAAEHLATTNMALDLKRRSSVFRIYIGAAGPNGLFYRELQLWYRLDPHGLTTIINRLVREGLPLEMNAQR